MRGATRLPVLLAVVLLTACGGHTLSSRPVPVRPSRPRLMWTAGETFSGAVSLDERDRGVTDDELRFSGRERFRVLRVADGKATVRVTVSGWRWRRNTSQLLTERLPAPSTFGVDAVGEILWGVDWPLPSQLPLPGLDVFAAPPSPAGGWARTDGAGVDLRYQAAGRPSPDKVTLTWSVVRPQFTRSGDPVTIRGHARVVVTSRYSRRGPGVVLRSTREQAAFERGATTAGGTTAETGTVLETTVFSYA